MNKRVAFITGATSGIGTAFAQHFAKEGYNLILTGLPHDKIPPCVEDLSKNHNVNVEIVSAELANENDVSKLENIIKGNDQIEVLINNAGFALDKPFMLDNVRNIENMIKVHINAPVRFIHAALPNMIRQKKGIIINMSSLSSFIPIPKDTMYSATKLFNNSFMESLHTYVCDKGIKVQVLCPGFVRTNFHASAGFNQAEFINSRIIPWMKPEKVVEISIKNLRKRNKVIVVPGFWNKMVKHIYTILPSRLYYRIASKYLQ